MKISFWNELPRSQAGGVSFGKFLCEPFIRAVICEVFWFNNKSVRKIKSDKGVILGAGIMENLVCGYAALSWGKIRSSDTLKI